MYQDKRKSNFRSILNIVLFFVFLLSLSFNPQFQVKATTYTPKIFAIRTQTDPVSGKYALNLAIFLEDIDPSVSYTSTETIGHLEIKLYKPSDPFCSNTPSVVYQQPVRRPVMINVYDSISYSHTTDIINADPVGFIPTEAGTWRWKVWFISNNNSLNQSTNTNCGDINVIVSPGLDTTPKVNSCFHPTQL